MSKSTPPLKDALWAAQRGRCWICESPMRFAGNKAMSATLDHMWPRAGRGRLGDVGLTLLAHKACNCARGAAEPSDAAIRKLIGVYRRMPQAFLLGHWRDAAARAAQEYGDFWRLRRDILAALMGRA